MVGGVAGATTTGEGVTGAVTMEEGDAGSVTAGPGAAGFAAVEAGAGGRTGVTCLSLREAAGSAHPVSAETAATINVARMPNQTNRISIGKEDVAMTGGEPLPARERILYVVATPLGNLRDITLRALDILGQVDVIAAEDTRVTAVLLARYGISARLKSLHEHNERRRAAEIVALLAAGESVALVADAGTPAISDPGAALVHAVATAGYAVVPVPGASAVTAALSAAGLCAPHWLFYGFLPPTASARRAELGRLRGLPFALVFYETPHRISAMLADLAAQLDPRRTLVIARELTKRFETIHRCKLSAAVEWLAAEANRQRGEFVLIVDAPPEEPAPEDVDANDAVLTTLLAELNLSQAVRIAVALTGAPRKRLYQRALELKREAGEGSGAL